MDKRALGKGLSALIPEKQINTTEGITITMRPDQIRDNQYQPRTNYDKQKLEDLKASIKEKGVLQPIIVRHKGDSFEVIAGERRLKAARELNLSEIPVMIKDVTDEEALVIALVENIQREELNPIEEAEAYHKLIENFHFTHENISKSVGKDRSTITNLLRLLKLPDNIKQSLYQGELSAGHARALLSLELPSEQKRYYEIIVKQKLSVREVEKLIKRSTNNIALRAKGRVDKSPEMIFLEEDLQRALGTKVRILSQKKRGKIVIEYYSLDDLDRIIKTIKQ